MYSKHYEINKNFQASINLELDLGNEAKINEYIPTHDICDVIKRYINVVLGKSKDRSTVLVGPYGKGKSFILLIISYLLGKNKGSKCWIDLVKKIKAVDPELGKMLEDIKKKKISLLPVLINSNYDNLTQSFLLALNEALKREHIENIIPDNTYNICISLIDKWNKDKAVYKEVLDKCISLYKINLRDLKAGLQSFSYKAYRQFEKLYNCVNKIGVAFNPLVNNDIIKMYKDVATQVTKHEYTGMFVIFDEFSKFIESNSSNLMHDLKIVQDFAELANRSDRSQQINLCCVTHKPLSLYAINKKQNNNALDSFKTVEGRFVEIRFNRSLEENYELIASAIIKKPSAAKICTTYLKDNKKTYDEIKKLSLFSDDKLSKTLFEGCFPLNPMTVYALIQLSEYVAQNERTLFTFLSDTDENSFNSFINNNDDGLFNVDKVYDYFEQLLQKEETNQIRNIWYRAESILSKINNKNERKVIKALAIILMINDLERLPASELIVSLCTSLSINEVSAVISKFINNHYLRKNMLNNMLSFALSNSKHIDDRIDYLSKTKFKKLNYANALNEINDHKYILPRRYNEQNKISRFYSIIFMTEEEFNNIKNFNYHLENIYCDGLIINLLKSKLKNKDIENKVNKINDSRVVIKYPEKNIESVLYKALTRYTCLKDILNQKDLDEISSQEVDLLISETESDIKSLIDKYFESEMLFASSFSKEKNINNLLSSILENTYSKKLIFNNELINKRTVTTQYQKAINHVIDYYLEGEGDFNYSETSPEASIKYSIYEFNKNSKDFREIIENIKKGITGSDGKKISVYSIVNKYSKPPYGVRAGIMPLLFTKAVSELSDNVLLYYQTQERDLKSSDIVKAVANENYFIKFSKKDIAQQNYLNNMLKLFGATPTNNFRKDTVLLANQIKRYFMGLPQIIRLVSNDDNYLELDKEYIDYKNLFLSFNLNSFEAVYLDSKEILKTKDYDSLYKKIKKYKDSEVKLIVPFETRLIKEVKNVFEINDKTSLKIGLNTWIISHKKKKGKPVLSEINKKFYELITKKLNYDDFASIEETSKILLGIDIRDWDGNNLEKLKIKLSIFMSEFMGTSFISIKEVMEKMTQKRENIELSSMGDLLKNNIQGVLDDFSDSVSEEEKISILSDFINKILN